LTNTEFALGLINEGLKLLLRREGLGEADLAERLTGVSLWTKHL